MIDIINEANDRIFVLENASLDEIEQERILKSKVIEIVDAVRLNHAYYVDEELENATYEDIKTYIDAENTGDEYYYDLNDEDYREIIETTQLAEKYYDEFCELYRLRAYVFYRLFSFDKSNQEMSFGEDTGSIITIYIISLMMSLSLIYFISSRKLFIKEKLYESNRNFIIILI